MSTCADLEDWVANYVEGSLPLPTRQELARHLDECGGCRELLAAYQRTVWVAKKALQCSSYPTQAPEQLVQTILGSLRR
jgi:anti-sigma factor RsiW